MIKTDSDGFLKHKSKAVWDEHLIRREIYNQNDFDVVFYRDPAKELYVRAANIPLGPEVYTLKAGGRVVLPHICYILRALDGREIFTLVQIFGDEIGTGQTKPSRPEVKVR